MGVKQKTKSLSARESELTSTMHQLEVLSNIDVQNDKIQSFQHKLSEIGYGSIVPLKPKIFQINIGKLCNQTCAHCHVDAGPDKKHENMSRETLEKCLHLIEKYDFQKVDITGGAPELNPHFKWFVKSCFEIGVEIMNRCNLTIIMSNKKYHSLPEFFAENRINVVSSLPYFSKRRTDAQRGDGVFEDSIAALKLLNEVGYGKVDSGLKLDLVYNPSGHFLPGDQASLEREFKSQLLRRYGIVFNQLFAITNLPISRFLEYLVENGYYQEYMTTLIESFNPGVFDGLMCRDTVSVSWDGNIYDCDFNQMLDLKVASTSNHIDKFDMKSFMKRNIVVNNHCFGCTAGAGSSCGGEIQ